MSVSSTGIERAEPDRALTLGDQVGEFVAAAPAAAASADAAEALLSDGCGLALALEARCRRLEREIGRLADRADDPVVARRLRTLPPKLTALGRQLEVLRATNAALRRRVGAAWASR